MTWHLDTDTIDGYVGDELDPAGAASAEAHLLGCAECRGRLARGVDADRLDGIWAEVVERVDAPVPTPLERLLLRLGVRGDTARLVAAAPSLRLSWLAGVAVVLGFALLASGASDRALVVFLALAPLLPVAGVAASYGPPLDPSFELATAAPYSGFRLLLLRVLTVVTATVLLVAAAAVLLPGTTWTAAAWLLPALALTGLTLALGTRVDLLWSGVAVAVGWFGLVGLAWRVANDPLLLFGGAGQLASLAVALACGALVAVRRDSLNLLRRNG